MIRLLHERNAKLTVGIVESCELDWSQTGVGFLSCFHLQNHSMLSSAHRIRPQKLLNIFECCSVFVISRLRKQVTRKLESIPDPFSDAPTQAVFLQTPPGGLLFHSRPIAKDIATRDRRSSAQADFCDDHCKSSHFDHRTPHRPPIIHLFCRVVAQKDKILLSCLHQHIRLATMKEILENLVQSCFQGRIPGLPKDARG